MRGVLVGIVLMMSVQLPALADDSQSLRIHILGPVNQAIGFNGRGDYLEEIMINQGNVYGVETRGNITLLKNDDDENISVDNNLNSCRPLAINDNRISVGGCRARPVFWDSKGAIQSSFDSGIFGAIPFVNSHNQIAAMLSRTGDQIGYRLARGNLDGSLEFFKVPTESHSKVCNPFGFNERGDVLVSCDSSENYLWKAKNAGLQVLRPMGNLVTFGVSALSDDGFVGGAGRSARDPQDIPVVWIPKVEDSTYIGTKLPLPSGCDQGKVVFISKKNWAYGNLICSDWSAPGGVKRRIGVWKNLAKILEPGGRVKVEAFEDLIDSEESFSEIIAIKESYPGRLIFSVYKAVPPNGATSETRSRRFFVQVDGG